MFLLFLIHTQLEDDCKVPYMLIIGEKEMQDGMVSVRKHGEGDKGSMTIEEFSVHLQKEILI